MFEEVIGDLPEDFELLDEDDVGYIPLSEILKDLKMKQIMPNDELLDFIKFLAMRHSKDLNKINYKKLVETFSEDFIMAEDERSIWLSEDHEAYQPSEDEGECESTRPPTPEPEPQAQGQSKDQMDDLDQNELLEKVDEILMQIVHRLPPDQKIRTLTHHMMRYLTPILDTQTNKQLLVIT